MNRRHYSSRDARVCAVLSEINARWCGVVVRRASGASEQSAQRRQRSLPADILRIACNERLEGRDGLRMVLGRGGIA